MQPIYYTNLASGNIKQATKGNTYFNGPSSKVRQADVKGKIEKRRWPTRINWIWWDDRAGGRTITGFPGLTYSP